MPLKPKRPCSYPGCPNLITSRFCDTHMVFYLPVPTQNIVVIARLIYVDLNISTQLLHTEVLADLMDKIAEAEDQVNAGKVMDADDSLNQIRKKYHLYSRCLISHNSALSCLPLDLVIIINPFAMIMQHSTLEIADNIIISVSILNLRLKYDISEIAA